MFVIATVSIAVFALFFLRPAYALFRNYVAASKTGLPFLVIPFDQNAVLWMIFAPMLRSWMEDHLPARLYLRLKYAIYSWEHREKLGPYHTIGNGEAAREKTFLISGTGKLEVWTASPSVASQILLRPKAFQQFDLSKLFIGQYGENVLTADGDEWSRHRKIVASAVTERINPIAWAESVRQISGLMDELCAASGGQQGETVRFFDMIKTVTVHVLSRAGMGIKKDWVPKQTARSDNITDVSYMDAVKLLSDNLSGPIIIPSKVLSSWPSFVPGYHNLRRLGLAKVLFPIRTQEMLTEEKQRLLRPNSAHQDSPTNLMRMLLVASDSSLEDTEKQREGFHRKLPNMTDEELISNLYVFTAAGYDTTANTIAYAVTLLIRYPKWQEWILAEIDRLLPPSKKLDLDQIMSNYQNIFPRCTRVLALMFETLRLFSPLVHLSKMVKEPQSITTDTGKRVVIPPNTTVYVNNIALHLDHNVWRDLNLTSTDRPEDWEGDMPGRHGATAADIQLGGGKLGDEWRFRPTRWIVSGSASSEGLPTESLFQPPRGSFVPWSMGPRVCPGQKMAQVEFTAILVMILSQYRLEAAPHPGESAEAVNKRLDKNMKNSISKLTLEMEDVYDKEDTDETSMSGIKVRLVRRER